jgi:hypothetical protein
MQIATFLPNMRISLARFFASLPERLERFFLYPFVGGITVILGVVAGYLGSHFDKEIAEAHYPFFWPKTAFATQPSLSWLIMLLFGLCFAGTFWAQAKSNDRITHRLNDAIRQLYTLPPRGFLEHFRETIKSQLPNFLNSNSTNDLDAIKLSIRVQLTGIMGLLSNFDSDGHNVRYACNIMKFVPTLGLVQTDPIVLRLEPDLRFVDTAVSITKLQGVLELLTDLSVASDESAGTGDSKLKKLVFPVPVIKGSMWDGCLPGAPYAFVAKKEVILEDMAELLRKVHTAHFTKTVRDELASYLQEQQPYMQSLICIPIYDAYDATSGQFKNPSMPVGILNIHRNRPNKGVALKFELLYPMLTSITLQLQQVFARI